MTRLAQNASPNPPDFVGLEVQLVRTPKPKNFGPKPPEFTY